MVDGWARSVTKKGLLARFFGSMPEEILNYYLSRAITQQEFTLTQSDRSFQEDLRMLLNIGVKFVGRSAFEWEMRGDDERHFQLAMERAEEAHAADPEMILQAAVFETTYKNIEKVPIPAWVFEEFGLEPEDRKFDYEAMLFVDGRFVDHWTPGGSVPDISRLETRLWFFYRSVRYIDAGYEALHMGQVHLIGANDPGYGNWYDLLSRIRKHAKTHARRGVVLIDAHTHGVIRDGVLLFDFHSYPLRPVEIPQSPQAAYLKVGHADSIYRNSLGGITPSGWETDSLPYLVEFDNCGGQNETPGIPDDSYWCWGYDEIAWFARQPRAYRNQWLYYAWFWLRVNDPSGWLQFPGHRTLGGAPVERLTGPKETDVAVVGDYKANSQSPACPFGFDQEETMKKIWHS